MSDRQQKTPEERAVAALGTAERVHGRLLDKLAKARAAVTAVEAEIVAARSRLAYVGMHPDLPRLERDRIDAYLAADDLGGPTPEQ